MKITTWEKFSCFWLAVAWVVAWVMAMAAAAVAGGACGCGLETFCLRLRNVF